MDTNVFKLKLVEEISKFDEILGIGQTGDIKEPLIKVTLKPQRIQRFVNS